VYGSEPVKPDETRSYALVVRVREGGRVVGVHVLVATGVNADGHREILGCKVTSTEDGAGWLAFFRGLVARGLFGVRLVTSDAHPALVAAIRSTLPGAIWQRCRAYYLSDLLGKVPKASQPWVATLVRTVFDQPDATAVHALLRPGGQGPRGEAAPGSGAPRGGQMRTCPRSRRARGRSGVRSGARTPGSG